MRGRKPKPTRLKILARAMLGQAKPSNCETQGLTILGAEADAPSVTSPAGWLIGDDDDRW